MMDTQTVEDILEIRRRVEAIEAAMIRTSELLAKAVQEKHKVQSMLSQSGCVILSSKLKGN
jgi:hypothetical protein